MYSAITKEVNTLYKTKEYLMEEYIHKKRSESDIAREWDISPKLLHYYIKKNGLVGIKSRRKYSVNEDLFSMANPIFCYYAGLIATDGYVDYKNHRVSVRVKNEGSKEVFLSLKKSFDFTGDIKRYGDSNDLTITSDKLIDKLRLFGMHKGETTKTYSLKIPRFWASEDCTRMFCRGVLDGDGNINIKGQFRIVTASAPFIEGLSNLLRIHLGIDRPVSSVKVHGVTYPKLDLRMNESFIFYDWVYTGFPSFRFSDKFNRYQTLKMKR